MEQIHVRFQSNRYQKLISAFAIIAGLLISFGLLPNQQISTAFAASCPVKLSNVQTDTFMDDFAFTPDGSKVLYIAQESEVGTQELFIINPDGTGKMQLGPSLTGTGKSVEAFHATNTEVVFVADLNQANVDELFVLPLTGGTPTRISQDLTGTGKDVQVNTQTFAITPDGTKVVFSGDAESDNLFELFVVPITGGTPTKLNGTLVNDGNPSQFDDGAVMDFLISPDGSTVVYRADQNEDEVFELFSVPISGGTTTRISSNLTTSNASVSAFYRISPNSSTVLYRSNQDNLSKTELYSVAIGGGSVTKLNGTLVGSGVNWVEISPDGTRAIYNADQDTNALRELYSVPIGGGSNTKLSHADMPAFGGTFNFVVGTTHVVFDADYVEDATFEYWSTPITGGTPVRVTPNTFVGNGLRTHHVSLAPNKTTVLYLADQDTNDINDLYSAPITGGGVTTKISPTLETFANIQMDYKSNSDMSFVIFRGDLEVNFTMDLFIVPFEGCPPPAPDVAVEKTNDTSDVVKLGDKFNWTLKVTNTGDEDAVYSNGERVVHDDLPTAATYNETLSITPTNLTGTLDCSVSGGVLECSANGNVTIPATSGEFSASIEVDPQSAGAMVNPQAVGICAVDPDNVIAESDETNNNCSDTVTVVAPDLTVAKTNDTGDDTVLLGDSFVWTVTASNDPTAIDAEFANGEVIIRDNLPIGATYTEGTSTPTGVSGTIDCSVASNVLECVADGAVTITAGGNFSVGVNVTTTDDGTLSNPAAAGVCAVDPNNILPEADETDNACTNSVTVIDPTDVELLQNGNFSAGTQHWVFGGSATSQVQSGKLALFNLTNGAASASLNQTVSGLAAGSPVQLTFELSNNTGAARNITAALWEIGSAGGGLRVCYFTSAVNPATQTFTLRSTIPTNWTNIRLSLYYPNSGITQAQPLVIDNVSLQHRPSITPSGTECTTGVPADTQLLRNGTFDTNTQFWNLVGNATGQVQSGKLSLYNLNNGAASASLSQDTAGLSAGSPVELTFDMNNNTGATRTLTVALWELTSGSAVRVCYFTAPAGGAIRRYTLRTTLPTNWTGMRVAIYYPNSGIVQAQPLVIDNVTLQYKPSLTPTGTECTTGVPTDTQLLQNGTFDTNTQFWSLVGNAAGQVQTGKLALYNVNNGAGSAALSQDTSGLSAGSPVELTFEMNNNTGATRTLTVALWELTSGSAVRVCYFNIPAGGTTRLFSLRSTIPTNWTGMRVTIYYPNSGIAQAQPLVIDNVTLQYKPSLTPSGTECTSGVPADTQLLQNGTFDTNTQFWNLVGNAAGQVQTGKLSLYNVNNGAGSASLSQDTVGLNAGSPVELTFQMSNNTGATRAITVALWELTSGSGVRVCYFNVPAGGTTRLYSLRSTIPTNWAGMRATVYYPNSGIVQAQPLVIDNVTLQHKPSLTPTGTECSDVAVTEVIVAEGTMRDVLRPTVNLVTFEDAFGGTAYHITEAENAETLSGDWTSYETAAAHDGAYIYSSGASEEDLTIDFTGDRFAVQVVMHPSLGSIGVEIDGVLVDTITLSNSEGFGSIFAYTLDAGDHTLRLYAFDGMVALDALYFPQ